MVLLFPALNKGRSSNRVCVHTFYSPFRNKESPVFDRSASTISIGTFGMRRCGHSERDTYSRVGFRMHESKGNLHVGWRGGEKKA